MAAAYIVSNNLQDRVNTYNKVIQMYKIDIIPKLGRITAESSNDEGCEKLAHELLQTEKV